MNCADFEKLIALDAEGDLPERKADKLEHHLLACHHCQAFAQSLRISQDVLKELASETPDDGLLQGVRVGVLNRLPDGAAPKAFPLWQFALGAAVVALLAVAAIMLRRPTSPLPIQVTAIMQPPAAMRAMRQVTAPPPNPLAQSPKRVQPSTARKSSAGAPRESAKRRLEPLMVKLYTDNPHVVIYWQVD